MKCKCSSSPRTLHSHPDSTQFEKTRSFTVIAAAILFCVQSRRTLRLSSSSTRHSCEQFQRSSEHDRDDNRRLV
ncbi:unnamed protein product [Adineta ricciae]|uniref:Uncharacterized protein n=1 Tax=Adineta ricciae TaxID=249248 RepID=A0A814Y8Z5_ADIRI|nr:unnamed protein product [Adineta ricciae]